MIHEIAQSPVNTLKSRYMTATATAMSQCFISAWEPVRAPSCEVVEVLCLEYYLSGACKTCEEESLAAEEDIAEALYSLDLILNSGLEGNHVTCIDLDDLTGVEVALYHIAVYFEESHALTEELLEDKALAAEKTCRELLGEDSLEVNCLLCAEESALLAYEAALRYINGNHRAGNCRAESDLSACDFCGVVSHEN